MALTTVTQWQAESRAANVRGGLGGAGQGRRRLVRPVGCQSVPGTAVRVPSTLSRAR